MATAGPVACLQVSPAILLPASNESPSSALSGLKLDCVCCRIPPGKFIKLHEGTWHAGPLFEGENSVAFYNLELADTNVEDHNTHVYEDVKFTLVLEE